MLRKNLRLSLILALAFSLIEPVAIRAQAVDPILPEIDLGLAGLFSLFGTSAGSRIVVSYSDNATPPAASAPLSNLVPITNGHVGLYPAISSNLIVQGEVPGSDPVYTPFPLTQTPTGPSTPSWNSPYVTGGRVYTADRAPASLATAKADADRAFTAALALNPDETNRGTPYANGNGHTLPNGSTLSADAPKVYHWTGDLNLNRDSTVNLTGALTDTIVLQITGDLLIGNNSQIVTLGTLRPENIFWVVSGNTYIFNEAAFTGYLLAAGNVTLYPSQHTQIASVISKGNIVWWAGSKLQGLNPDLALLPSGIQRVGPITIIRPVPTLELACSPSSQTVEIDHPATFYAYNGSGAYTWTAPNSAGATGDVFTLSYSTTGTRTITVTSHNQDPTNPTNVETATCQLTVVDKPSPRPLVCSPDSAGILVNESITFTASGGDPDNYTWSDNDGHNGTDEDFTVSYSTSGTRTITVRSTRNNRPITDTCEVRVLTERCVSGCGPASVMTCSPPTQDAQVGEMVRFSASGRGSGRGPYRWSAEDGNPAVSNPVGNNSNNTFQTSYVETDEKEVWVTSARNDRRLCRVNVILTTVEPPLPPTPPTPILPSSGFEPPELSKVDRILISTILGVVLVFLFSWLYATRRKSNFY